LSLVVLTRGFLAAILAQNLARRHKSSKNKNKKKLVKQNNKKNPQRGSVGLQAGVPAAELAQVARLCSRDANEAIGVGEMCREHAELGLQVGLRDS
jgi:hypothetical protein